MYTYTESGEMVEITETLEELEKDKKKCKKRIWGWRLLKAFSLTYMIMCNSYGHPFYALLSFIPFVIGAIKCDIAQDDYTLVLRKIEKIKE